MSFNPPGSNSSTSSSAFNGSELLNDITINNPPDDTITDLSFSPQHELLAVASWDNKVRVYEIEPATGNNQGRAVYEHEGPVFSARWTHDDTKIVSGGADKQVKIFDLQSQQSQQIGVHNEAVRVVRCVECGPSNTPVVVSGSWDKTLRFWDMRTPQPVIAINLPERVYCMDSSQKLLVVGCAERHIAIINLDAPETIFKTALSPLKYQTRALKCYPQANGYALGSIEGRCAIQYIDEAEQSKSGFTFRCHRNSNPQGPASGLRTSTGESHAYPVNSIGFHPVYGGTFSTAGSDGTFAFWDKEARQKLQAFPPLGHIITATTFNSTGTIFAYATGYDWSQGFQANRPDYPIQIKLHGNKDEEVQPRRK